MIEVFFFRGMRFSWDPHGVGAQGDDGNVEANPMLPARPMVYQGVDMDMCTGPYPARRQLAINAGLRLGSPINFSWLLYKPGRTVTAGLATTDVLTGFMSGCPIVTFTTQRRLVAHVGTVANNAEVNTLVKQKIRAILPANARGFDPSGAWTTNDRAALMQQLRSPAIPQVVALVTSGGNFFSILVGKYPNQPQSYVIGGCVPVAGWDHAQLQNVLA